MSYCIISIRMTAGRIVGADPSSAACAVVVELPEMAAVGVEGLFG